MQIHSKPAIPQTRAAIDTDDAVNVEPEHDAECHGISYAPTIHNVNGTRLVIAVCNRTNAHEQHVV